MCFNMLTAKLLYFYYNKLNYLDKINLENNKDSVTFLISLYNIKSLLYCKLTKHMFITEAKMLYGSCRERYTLVIKTMKYKFRKMGLSGNLREIGTVLLSNSLRASCHLP